LNKQCIFFRVDGNSTIGLGHVSRCIALADLLSEDFEIVFAICEPSSYILKEVEKVSDRIITLPLSNNAEDFNNEIISHLTGREIVILDGYNFTTAYEACVKMKSAAVVVIDDIPSRHFSADSIINFCGAIRPTDYSKEFYTQLYLGLDYVFLRSPFLRVIRKKKVNNTLLLNMGGADPTNETYKILRQILDFGFTGEIVVVVGESYQFKELLETLINSHSFIRLQQGLTAEAMFDTMNSCNMAILPPSTVALEYLSTGGLLFLNLLAENQRCMKKYLLSAKFAFEYSVFAEFIKNTPHVSLFEAETKIFDGLSLQRVKGLFNSLGIAAKMKYRKALEADATIVFSWVIDPDVRQFSYSKSEILWEDHVQWFSTKVTDTHCEYFIIEIDSVPIAQIRFDASTEEEAYVISYLIDKNWRGKGLGSLILTKGMQKLKELQNVKKIVGYVQNFNIASTKAFERAGFRKIVALKYPDSSKFELSF